MIEMRKVDKFYGDFQVLRDIDLHRRARRAHRHLRPVRLRQVDADPLPEPARGASAGEIVVDGTTV
jgi:hypothetical protein